MKIAILLGDDHPRSPEAQLAELALEMIGRDAEAYCFLPSSPLPAADGVWIFTHEEDGGCPPQLLDAVKENFSLLARVPVAIAGVGGKDGGMNAVTELSEFFEEQGKTLAGEEPFCLPLRAQKVTLDAEERMDLFWHVDEFLTAVERSLRG